MTGKAAFNAEEWTTVVEGPLLAGMRVVAASRGGTIRESLAVAKVYRAAREAHADSEFLDALVSSPPEVDAQQARQAGDIAAFARERLREALRIVRDKATPDEVDEYKRFVVEVADAAARAHKEGGFIGIGGKEISAEEQAALDEIQGILDA